MKISQETYDETLLENEEIFELSPAEAIKETISQFKQQGITDLDSYIITSHPSSDKGKEERLLRSNFTSLLNKLDSFIRSDGKIEIDESNSEVILETIENVHEYLRNGESSKDESSKDESTEQSKNDNEKSVGDPVPFLTLAQSSSSLYTFMNLLSIIDFPTNEQQQQGKLPLPTKDQTSILHASLKLLITILCPRSRKEKDIKMTFKDGFVCFGRMVGLIVYHTNLVQQLYEGQGNGEDSLLLNEYIVTIRLVIKCTMNACKNCEKNKVLFVRCLRATCITDSLESLINNFHQLGLLPTSDGSCSDVEKIITKKQRESTIGIVSNLVRFTLSLYNNLAESTEEMNIIEKYLVLELMTESCTLITVLCRFDDFRQADGAVDSSYGGVSSAHDHVLEFNREGIIPSLHKLILLSLDQKSEVENSNGSTYCYDGHGVALAAAAMSATRVLAVNDEIVQALVAVGVLKTIKVVLDMGVVSEVGEGKEISNKVEASTKDNNIEDSDNIDIEEEKNEEEGDYEEENNNEEENEKLGQNDSNEKTVTNQKQQLTTGAIGLIRNLCGNDEIKTTLCLGSTTSGPSDDSTVVVPSVLPSIIRGMSMYKNAASIQEHGCGALAAMALRKPSNALRIIHENGAASILTAMKLFSRNVLVQRQGALAVRNIVSRLVANPTAGEESLQNQGIDEGKDNTSSSASSGEGNNVRDVFLDLGAEVILRGITGRHQGSVDEAYAALRDLGCSVSMVKYDAATQTATSRTVMFGDVKPKFRPVYDES